jgi:lipoyl(octanoyl) transferase
VAPTPVVRWLGRVDYEPTWRDMQRFTDQRDSTTPDELWLLEHPPVFTLGMNADPAHVLGAGDIPVVRIDRGGQVTYHGPGQLMAYVLWDLKRSGVGVRALVTALEQAVIRYVAGFGITAPVGAMRRASTSTAPSSPASVFASGAARAIMGSR